MLGSSVVAAYITHKLSSSEKEKDFKRQKLEQLYLCISDFQLTLLSNVTMTAGYHAGKVSREDVNKEIGVESKTKKQTYDNLQMITNLYFPDLVPYLKKVEEVRDVVGAVGLKESMFGSPPDKTKAIQIIEQLRPLMQNCDDFKAALFNAALKINKG
jgi:hypothetical protein